MAVGGILAEEEVILVEETPEEEEEEQGAEIPLPHTTNSRDNNQAYSKGTDGSRKPSCKNGISITGSTDTPPK